MSLFDDNPPSSPEENFPCEASSDEPGEQQKIFGRFVSATRGRPPFLRGLLLLRPPFQPIWPKDFAHPWSWPHLLSLSLVLQSNRFWISSSALTSQRTAPLSKSSRRLLIRSKLIIGTIVLWFAHLFVSLCHLAVLRDSPFWRSLGGKKLNRLPRGQGQSRGCISISGCACPLRGSRQFAGQGRTTVPLHEFFKNRTGAFSLMAMAVSCRAPCERPSVSRLLYRSWRVLPLGSQFSALRFHALVRRGGHIPVDRHALWPHARRRWVGPGPRQPATLVAIYFYLSPAPGRAPCSWSSFCPYATIP